MTHEWARFFHHGGAELTREMKAALICQRLGWTWDQYLDQPMPFINALVTLFNAEAKAAKNNAVE